MPEETAFAAPSTLGAAPPGEPVLARSGATPESPAEAGDHWQARARSIKEVEAALSRIWAREAQAAREEGLSRSDEAAALGDPRLAGRLDRSANVRVRTRTSVLTLVVIAPRPETAERGLDAVNHLRGRHPSRAVIVAPGDPDGPSSIDAQIFASCQLSEGRGSEICTEQILIRTGGEINQHLAGVVTPLLIHDLPVVLWWPDDPPVGQKMFRDLLETCDRLLVDSGSFRDDGAKRLAGVAAVCAGERPTVADIGWMRLTLWRELLAGLFDHPLLAPELPGARGLRIDIARPGDVLRLPKAAMFAGWLAAMLDWELVRPLEQRRGSEVLGAEYRRGRQPIRVEFRPGRADSESIRTAGSLTRVELELGRAGREVRARVTRQADHLLATAEWNGAQVTRRAGRVEAFDEMPYLAEALQPVGTDRVFADALGRAVRLIGG